jgi:hypothetical protein
MAPTAPGPNVGPTGNRNLFKVGVIMSYITRKENRITKGEAEYSLGDNVNRLRVPILGRANETLFFSFY